MVAVLDIGTLGIAMAVVDTALSVALVLLWRKQKTYHGFGLWVVGQCLTLPGHLFMQLRGSPSQSLAFLGVSAIVVSIAALRARALSLYFDRAQSPVPDLVAGALLLLVASWFVLASDATVGRMLALVACVTFIMGRAAVHLVPAIRSHGTSAVVAIAFLVTWPAALVMVVGGWLALQPLRPSFVSTVELKVFLLFLLAYKVAITIFFLVLNAHRLTQELVAAQLAQERLAVTDPLTGLLNRRKFVERMSLEWKRQRRGGAPLSLLVVDIDHFKSYNDTYGHLDGDACLVRVAATMHGALREEIDTLARVGGEEFVILLPDSGPEQAAAVAERLREAVEEMAVPHGAPAASPVVTVSVGWASTTPASDERGPDALLALADAALYRAKRQGRNRVAAMETG